MSEQFNVQDFSLIKTNTNSIYNAFKHENKSSSFTWFVLKTMFEVDNDTINESITDTSFVGNHKGHDRGLDVVYIEDIEEDDKKEIHFFNIKYTEDVNKSRNNNFPSNEIDKVVTSIDDIFQLKIKSFDNCNLKLKDKIVEVTDIIQGDPNSYKIILHFCSNYYKGMANDELSRAKNRLNKYRNLDIVEDTLSSIVQRILINEKEIVNGKVQYSINNGFIKTDGNSRALIFSINAVDLLSLVSKNSDIRKEPSVDDLEKLKFFGIDDDAFDMNIRKYQKKRNRINKNIKDTAVSDERKKVFYYNNGITVICDKFSYGDTSSTVLTIENLQVVNGCQTVHSLYDALLQDDQKLKNVDLLCRLYEITDKDTYLKIAEFTNSQTKVTGRDLKSNDEVQRKLDHELSILGFTYERKKVQHNPSDDLSSVIDSEKLGQLLMAYNNNMPGKAKNRKVLIFGEEYENIFHDKLTAEEAIEIIDIYKKIELKRIGIEKKIKTDDKLFERYHFIVYSSFYILYTLSKIKFKNQLSNGQILEKFDEFYKISLRIISRYLSDQKKQLKERYSASSIFKNQALKDYIDKSKLTEIN